MEKIKYKNDDSKQLDLGVKVTKEAYNRAKKTKYLCDAVDRTLKKYDAREIAILPRSESIQRHVRELTKAINEKKRPEGTRGYQIVLQKAYDEITGGQMSIQVEDSEAADAVSTKALSPQEDLASQCNENAEADSKPEEKLAPEELEAFEVDDSWSDTNPSYMSQVFMPVKHDIAAAYLFLTDPSKCTNVKIFEGKVRVTMEVKTWESLF